MAKEKVAKQDETDGLADDLAKNALVTNDSEDSDGYGSDIEPVKYYRERLVIGDGDFSYTHALLKKHAKKHPGLGGAITTTEYASEEDLNRTYENFAEHKLYLKQKNVKLLFNVDARSLHEDRRLKERYKRIHFNCPHDKSDFKQQTLPKLINGFFASANKKQQSGDRVYMALPKPQQKNAFYKGYVYDLYRAAAQNGYRLKKKRTFGCDRYPGYNHVITGINRSATVTETMKEYIFEKTDLDVKAIIRLDTEQGRAPSLQNFYNTPRICIKEIDTDDDSSTYETDSENVAPVKRLASK